MDFGDLLIGIFGVMIVVATIIVIILCIFLEIASYTNEQTFDMLISNKYVKSDTYFVVDSDKNTYVITDLFFKGKFNSSDLYNQIEINQKYKVTITGHRIRLFSQYQNINKIEKVVDSNE